MLLKITHGFVIQTYNEKKKQWMSQEFVAGDTVEWENRSGQILPVSEVPDDAMNAYLPFEMVQPRDMK